MAPRCLLIVLLAVVAGAQEYSGPRPEKPDLPYLKHAGRLVPTEAATATEEKKKDSTTFIIENATSPAVTPLASPIFLIQAEKLNPERLGLFKLEVKDGRRQITETSRKPLQPLRVEAERISPDKIWKIEVEESLEPGEYSLSPDDSNQVFCFQVR